MPDLRLGKIGRAEALRRLMAKVEVTEDSCWLWTGYQPSGMHGRIYFGEQGVYVHRLSYELHVGTIPAGAVICHHCDVPNCVNPEHLFLGTQADNVADMESKGRARKRCPRGTLNAKATLAEDQVNEIRALWDSGEWKQRDIAARFGCSQSTVWRIVHGQTRSDG